MANEIIRFINDSYPITTTIKVNKSAVDLTGWTVYFNYDEIQSNASVKNIRIEGRILAPTTGKVKFYPRPIYTKDITAGAPGVEYTGFTVEGTHEFSIVREKEHYEASVSGTLVIVGDVYVAYDSGNPAHDTLIRYNPYMEKMTHNAGSLIISNRVGL